MLRHLGCPAYLRYVDDFLLFANNADSLWRWRDAIIDRLAELRLTLHEQKAVVRPTSEGTRFLGFYLYPTHRRLVRRKGLQYRRKLVQLLAGYAQDDVSRAAIERSVRGWINHVRYGDTWGLRKHILQEMRL